MAAVGIVVLLIFVYSEQIHLIQKKYLDIVDGYNSERVTSLLLIFLNIYKHDDSSARGCFT